MSSYTCLGLLLLLFCCCCCGSVLGTRRLHAHLAAAPTTFHPNSLHSPAQTPPRTTSAFAKGNLILTQPNEIETKHYLAEFSPQGHLVDYYSLGGLVQPIDLRFVSNSELLLLDFRYGLYTVHANKPDSPLTFGYNQSLIENHSLYGLEVYQDKIFVLDEHSNFPEVPRKPAIHLWSRSTGLYQKLWTTQLEHPAMIKWYNNRMYVSELDKIAILDESGNRLQEWKPVQVPSEKWKIITGLKFYSDELYVGLQGIGPQKDAVLVLDPQSGKIRRIIEMQGKQGGGLPNAFAFREDKHGTPLLYVDNSESWVVDTQRIQVYNAHTGEYLEGFGGVQCSDLLCQTFNGFEFNN